MPGKEAYHVNENVCLERIVTKRRGIENGTQM